MSQNHLQIDLSKSKRGEDLIKIRLKNEDFIQINFRKLFYQSNYIRDKYKYSEAMELIQEEIDEIEEKKQIKGESIKFFIELIQEEKVELPIEHYKDIYKLSEHFCIPTMTTILDNIGKKSLFKDFNFTIQILHDYETVNNGYETKLTIKIENFLKKRINECLQNSKFGEFGISTIFRLINESKEKVDYNLLVDFILESSVTRFMMFKLVKIEKLREDKFYELIKFLESQEEKTQQMYLEYIPFNISLIQNMMNKYDQVLKEKNETIQELDQIKIKENQTRQELYQTKIKENQARQELDQTRKELNQARQKLNQTKQELDQTKIKENQARQELNQTKQELDQAKIKINQTKQELDQAKIKINQTKQELDQAKHINQEPSGNKREMKQAKNPLNQISKKGRYTRLIIVGGYDQFNGLGLKPNNKKYGISMISPPVKLSFDPSSLLSYSAYGNHSVLVMSDGSLKGAGDNKDGKISATLQKSIIEDFTDFCIKNGSGRQLDAISAVCYQFGTLYMFSKSRDNERHLVLCDEDINGGDPVFLDIGNHYPVSLFGGHYHSAAIGSEGEIIFINRKLVKNSPKSPIESVSLPDGEKASSVACCEDSVVVLSSNGRVFSSNIESNRILKFSIVPELSCEEIVCVSGTFNHFLAVSKEGRVFGRGSNDHGQLGLGKKTGTVSRFKEIQSPSGYEIRAAYAGHVHSLFETREGKVFSCGHNYYGELLLSSGAGDDVYSPSETMITRGASFCIAGNSISAVFIGRGPPPNTPNIQIY